MNFGLPQILVYILFILYQLQRVCCDPSDVLKLRSDLLKNYDKNDRPNKNLTEATNVTMFYDLKHIVALDEKLQILTVNGILIMQWKDEHLVWNPADYGNLKVVRFAMHEVWTPAIQCVYNVKPIRNFEEDGSTVVLVNSDGSVKWYPPSLYDVPCSTKFKHYPFDEHNCTLIFSAWTHSGAEVSLKTTGSLFKPSAEYRSLEWNVQNVIHQNASIIYTNYFPPKPLVHVHVYLERASRIYRYICVIPTIVSLLTTLTGFWLTHNEIARYMIGCSNVILISLLLQHLALTVPAGKDIPLIAQYSAACLCMSGAFLIITIVVKLVSQSPSSPPVNIVRLSRETLDRFFCLSLFMRTDVDKTSVTGSPDPNMVTSFEEMRRKNDWNLIALVLDRLAFWVFVLIYIVLVSVLASI